MFKTDIFFQAGINKILTCLDVLFDISSPDFHVLNIIIMLTFVNKIISPRNHRNLGAQGWLKRCPSDGSTVNSGPMAIGLNGGHMWESLTVRLFSSTIPQVMCYRQSCTENLLILRSCKRYRDNFSILKMRGVPQWMLALNMQFRIGRVSRKLVLY